MKSVKDPPISRHMFVVQGVRQNRPLNEFLATIPEGHIMNLYVGGENGFTFASQKEKGFKTVSVVVNRTELTAHESWKLHVPDRESKTEIFNKLMGTPYNKPGEIQASISPEKTTVGTNETPEDWEDEFNLEKEPVKSSVNIQGQKIGRAHV